MMNLNRIVRNAGVAEVSEIQATGGAKVEPRKPTKEDAQMLGMLWQEGLKLKSAFTKAQTSLLEALGPITTTAEDRAVAILTFTELAEQFGDAINTVVEKIHALPRGTTPPGWTGPDARANAIASLCGKIGSNLDRIITPATATKALRLVYKS